MSQTAEKLGQITARTTIASKMKIFFRFFALFIFVLLLLFAAPIILEFVGRKEVPEMTPEKAQKLFETVGGEIEVNREARTLFDRLGTNNWTFLYPEDLTVC